MVCGSTSQDRGCDRVEGPGQSQCRNVAADIGLTGRWLGFEIPGCTDIPLSRRPEESVQAFGRAGRSCWQLMANIRPQDQLELPNHWFQNPSAAPSRGVVLPP